MILLKKSTIKHRKSDFAKGSKILLDLQIILLEL